jgi:hypothetical protein
VNEKKKKIISLVIKKNPPGVPEGLLYGWVSKYWEINFPTQYYKEFSLTKKYFPDILLTF